MVQQPQWPDEKDVKMNYCLDWQWDSTITHSLDKPVSHQRSQGCPCWHFRSPLFTYITEAETYITDFFGVANASVKYPWVIQAAANSSKHAQVHTQEDSSHTLFFLEVGINVIIIFKYKGDFLTQNSDDYSQLKSWIKMLIALWKQCQHKFVAIHWYNIKIKY